MAGYIGSVPVPQATETRDVYTATSNQTTFTTGGYTPNFVSVYLNGVHLARADYTATNGSDVVLAVGAAADDTVEIVSFATFEVSAQTFTGDVTASGGTFLPTGDTAAGDDAAVGYAAADGLVLTGQGSTSDITLKNDADAVVFTVPTGTDDILFPDNAKAMFGAGSDLQIYHNGSASYISEQGTGNLVLGAADSIIFQNAAHDENMLVASQNGAVSLYYDNAIKLATTATGVEITGAATVGGAKVKVAGKETIWVPASAMQPTTSNGCSALTTVETTSGRPDLVVLDFDKDSDEFAQFSVAFPKSWNAGTVTFQVFWAGIAATTDVDWMVDAVAISNNTTIDVAYGTAVVVTDNAQGAVEELNVSAESGALTIAGSPGDDELCFFRIGRDVSGDAMAGDARLVGIKLFFTTDLANDG